jgi:Mrp family chromosome partitioning ATPase/uncharacterized protein involved in exopolysaccharide biosynthesis
VKNVSEANQNGAQQQSELFEFNLLQLANYLFSHRWWIIIGTSLCISLAIFWVTLIKKPVYRASVTINVDLNAEDKGAANNSPFFMQDQAIANKIGIVEQYFDSSEFKVFLFRTMATADLPENLQEDLSVIKDELIKNKVDTKDEIADWVHGRIDLKGMNDKSRIDLSASAQKPALASAIANIGAYALIEYNRLMLVQRLKSLKNFLHTQTSQTKGDLRTLENELVGLQKQAKIISPEEVRVKVNGLQVDQEAKLIEFDRQYASLNTLISETEADLNYFKKLMQENQPASYLYIEQIQRRLEVLRYQKLQAAEGKGSGRSVASDMPEGAIDKGITEVVGELSKQLESLGPVASSPWDYVKKIETGLFELKQKRAQAKSELAAQENAVQRTTKEFIGLPEVLKKMSEVKRNIDLTTSLYTALMTRLQDTQIREAAHSNDLVMVSSAESPGAPSGLGRSKTVMLAIIGGLILSCLPLFLRFVLLPTIRNVKDLNHLNVPIIGSVGWLRGGSAVKGLPLKMQERTPRILSVAPNSTEANALRFVRFQLEQALGLRAFQKGQASKILMVSSVNSKEGRSFTAANLADLFATSGIRTCLMDLDFANPSSTDYFPEATLEDIPITDLFPKSCGFEMFKVANKLTLLKPQPKYENMSEVLETREFESALNGLEVIFELIIIDTPPLNGHMEPVIAAQYADALLLVVNQRRTLRTEVEDAIRILQRSLKLPIFGMMNFTFDEVAQGRRKQKVSERRRKKNEKAAAQESPTPKPKAS